MSAIRIQSPLPGVFYRSAGPGEPPLKSEGDRVASGEVVGLVEVMKMFNEVRAEVAGVIESFLVEDEEAVEAGQDLIVLRVVAEAGDA